MDQKLKSGAIFDPENVARERMFEPDVDESGMPLPPPAFYWCVHCERAYRRGEFRQLGALQMCPYTGCDGDAVLDAWPWESIRNDSPYPDEPLEGVVYPMYPSNQRSKTKKAPAVFNAEELEKLLSHAFAPYLCEVEVSSDAATVDLAIINEGKKILVVRQQNQAAFSDKSARSLIAQARKQLGAWGFKLKRWKFPERAI